MCFFDAGVSPSSCLCCWLFVGGVCVGAHFFSPLSRVFWLACLFVLAVFFYPCHHNTECICRTECNSETLIAMSVVIAVVCCWLLTLIFCLHGVAPCSFMGMGMVNDEC